MNDVQEIDVDELMAQVRANLPRQGHLSTTGASTPFLHGPVAAELSALQNNREIRYFHLTSHRKLLGSFVLLAKKLALKLLTPSLERQTGYNTANMSLAWHFWEQLEGLQRINHELVGQINELRQTLTAQVAEVRHELTQQREQNEELAEEIGGVHQEQEAGLQAIRGEFAAQIGAVHPEQEAGLQAIRGEFAAQIGAVQQKQEAGLQAIRGEFAAQIGAAHPEQEAGLQAIRGEFAAQIGAVQQKQEAGLQAIRGEFAAQIGAAHPEQEAGLQAIRGEFAAQIGAVQQKQEAGLQAIRGEFAAQIGAAHREREAGLQAIRVGFAAQIGAVQQKQSALQAEIVDGMTEVRQAHTAAFPEMRERFSRVERRLRRFIAVSTDGQNADLSETQPSLHHTKPMLERTPGPSFDYFGFEERFRGSEEDIKERQRVYVEFFKDVEPVLDIGCGRGEFLELAREAGIKANGVDLDLDMILYCQEKGLDVVREDAFACLESIPDDSLGGIFAAQLVEHLEPTRIIELVNLCHRKLQMDGVLIFETPNPVCLTVFARSFYLDLSHVRPIHPEAMKFLLESAGFKDLQVRFSSPVEPSMRIPPIAGTAAGAQEIEEFNQGIERLNELLYGFQDFAVIGKKSSRL